MRIAFVHDWLVVSGGAEKVTREILKTFDADVFSLIDFLNAEDRTFLLGGKRAKTTFIQHLPFARTQYRNYLPLFPSAIESLDLSDHDLIISASYAVAKGVRKGPEQIHICYIHTPMRYAWLREDDYLRDHRMSGFKAWVIRRVLKRLRTWDLKTNGGVDHFIANSSNVARRVHELYGRDADVLIPPVDTSLFKLYAGEREHYLSASRLVPYKRVDRMIEAFRSMPERTLMIAGDGPDRVRLERSAPTNVRFLGHLPQADLVTLLQRSKALITAADEDLGLTPIEAQACGTPTIALRKGGYLETVKEGVNGVFFDTDGPADIIRAVERFESSQLATPAQIREGMMIHSSERFRERFAETVSRLLKEHGR
jgi:glycosyltransferase involved in cell wall biosynthesis